ncbi:MAG: hypothetical protein LBT23_06375 [Synergistaceae bacterium]|nr:hypothetical protein [Synergistaceae bacterium]
MKRVFAVIEKSNGDARGKLSLLYSRIGACGNFGVKKVILAKKYLAVSIYRVGPRQRQ